MRLIAGTLFEVIDVPMDGHCLFSAISHGLVGSDALAWQLRCDAVGVVTADWDTFAPYTESVDRVPYPDAASYATSMFNDVVPGYGGVAEIKALAALHLVRVRVYEGDALVMDEDPGTWHVVHLLFVRGMKHYMALETVAEGDDDPPVCDSDTVSDCRGDGGSDFGSQELGGSRPSGSQMSDDLFSDEPMESETHSSEEDLFGGMSPLPEPYSIGSARRRTYRVDHMPGYIPCRPSVVLPRLTMPQGTYQWARLYQDEPTSTVEEINLGAFDSACDRCGALYWHAERKASGDDTRAWCCGDKVFVDLGAQARFHQIRDPEVHELYYGTSDDAVHFRRHARAYNHVLSIGMPSANYERRQVMGETVIAVNGKATFQVPTRPQVQGDGLPAQPGQLYFVEMTDESVAKRIRTSSDPNLRPHIVSLLEKYLRRHNPLVQTCLLAKEIMERQDAEQPQLGQGLVEGRGGLHLLVNPHRDGVRATDRPLFENNAQALRPPTSDFVAAVFEGDEPRYNYDVALYPRNVSRGKSYVVINENSPTLDVLMYSLVHLHGEDSWINIVDAPETAKRRRTESMASQQVGTLRSYYASRLLRRGERGQDAVFRLRGLFQQLVADAGVKIEDGNLRYAREHQDELNVCMYDNLQKYVQDVARANNKTPGRVVVLPRNRQKSERRMHENYVDAVTISAHTTRPTVLVTLTTNPRWPEIVAALAEVGLQPDEYVHAPDVVVRAFLARVDALLGDLVGKAVLGRVASYVGVTEFTESFLPHFHLVLMLQDADRPDSADDVDSMVSAEIPDREAHPELHKIVMNLMIHRPCDGSSPNYKPSCRGADGKCRHGFPFDLRESTDASGAKPLLRRRPSPQVWHQGFRCMIDNRWVAPYNPKLLLRYQCHLNVMMCGQNMHWMYLFGYIMKECGAQYVQGAMLKYFLSLTGRTLVWDEIEFHQKMRMMSPYEAVFYILGIPFVRMSHTVQSLPIHLPGKQYVYYRGDPCQAASLQEQSKLLAWFLLNQDPNSGTQHILYGDIVETHKYENKKWVRKTVTGTLGRLMHVTPSSRNMELFFLRLLLLNRPGMRSFQDILTVEGRLYGTFREACEALGLSATGGVAYDDALQEVVERGRPWQIRRFFAVLAASCYVSNMNTLWVRHRDAMSRDCRRGQATSGEAIRRARAKLLREVLELMDAEGELEEERRRILLAFSNSLTVPSLQADGTLLEAVLPASEDEVTDDDDVVDDDQPPGAPAQPSAADVADYYSSYTLQQRAVHDEVMAAIEGGAGEKFFSLQAPAGCGKTYVYNGLLRTCRSRGIPAVACAMTGIAATLLDDGDTAHKAFGIPVRSRVDGSERSYIEVASMQGQALLDARLIVVDEVSMMALWQAKLIDNLLRDITGHKELLFGGKVVLFGGDLAQIPPVMRGQSMQVVTRHCLPAWECWVRRRPLVLSENRRAHRDPRFAAWLSRVRDGSANIGQGDDILVPGDYLLASGGRHAKIGKKYTEEQRELAITALFQKVYGDMTPTRLEQSVILAPTNAVVRGLNARIVDLMPGPERPVSYFSRTLMDSEEPAPPVALPPQGRGQQAEAGQGVGLDGQPPPSDGRFQVVQEELNNIERPNIPPHHLRLQLGSVVMLLKNFNKRQGLCNGTRLTVVSLHKHVICLRRITPHHGHRECMFYPRMWLRSDDVPLGGSIQRYQFPVSPASAITINKAQGQGFEYVGVFLETPVFSHGQFYVAVSRVTEGAHLSVVVMRGPNQGPPTLHGGRASKIVHTKNIVIRSLLE